MRNDELSRQSMDFAVQIINLVKGLKAKHETVISNQIGRSGTSIGANIREAQYAHGKPDFISKLQIALKEANETRRWLNVLKEDQCITPLQHESMSTDLDEIIAMLIASIKTSKKNQSIVIK